MFQNINAEYDENEELNEEKTNKREIILNKLKDIFSIRNIIYYILCFGASMIGFGDNISPFGLALLAATCSNKMPVGIVYIACLAGTVIGQGQKGLLIYILTSLVFITFSLIYRPKYENVVRNEKKKLGPHLIISTFLVQAMGLMFGTFYVYDLLTSILLVVITYIFYKIFTNSLKVLQEYGEKTAFTIEEIMGAILFIAIGISPLANVQIYDISIRNVICILLVLILGWKNGILVGSTGGITIGMVLGIIGKGDPILIAAFAVSGLIAGILNKFGKIGVIVGFVTGTIVLTFIANGNTATVIHLKEILIASIWLLLIPKSIDISVTDLVGKSKLLPISKERMLEEKKDTAVKLNSVSDTISEISKSYKEVAATTAESVDVLDDFIDYVLEKMEENEDNILYDDLENTDNGILEEMFDILQDKKEIYAQDIIDVFQNHNSYIVGQEEDILKVVKIVNGFNQKESNLSKKERSKDENISRGLDGVSKVILTVADNINKKEDLYEKEREKLEILLLQKGIAAYDINIKKLKSGKVVVSIYSNQNEKAIDEAIKIQKIEEILLKVFGEKLSLKNQKDEMLVFASDDKYKITIAMTGTKKNGSEISGDSSIRLKMNDGKILIALSDGMGSGREANKVSSSVIKMIKNLMSAGFEEESATQLINNLIAMKAQSETFATLDMLIFDLYAGNLEVLKNYACPTYIKREKETKIINAISLPTGILSNIESVVFDTDLQKGDIIIMCTDGIIEANKEAINKEEAFKNFIKSMKTDNVKKMADIILQEAIDQDYGKPKDDMSVVVAKIS